MIRSLASLALVLLTIVGCARDSADPQPRKSDGDMSLLSRTDSGDVNNFGELILPSRNGQNAELDRLLGNECAPQLQARIAPLVASVIVMAAGWVIDYAISEASAAAQHRLAEYQGLTAQSMMFGPPKGYFYSSVAPPAPALACVRLRRIVVDAGTKKSTLAAEAIIKVDTVPAGDALRLTPLRIYFDAPLARVSGDRDSKFGISLGATFDGLWQAASTGEGKQTRIWSSTVVAQKIRGLNADPAARPRFYYYNLGSAPTDTDNQGVNVPLVPWSLNNTASKGMGTLTLTLAEVGDAPGYLKFIAGTLKDHGSDIGGFLKDAVKKAVAPDGSGG